MDANLNYIAMIYSAVVVMMKIVTDKCKYS